MEKLGVGCEIENKTGADDENGKDGDDLVQYVYGQVEELFVLLLLCVDVEYSSSINQLYQILDLGKTYHHEKETKWLIRNGVTRIVLHSRYLKEEI